MLYSDKSDSVQNYIIKLLIAIYSTVQCFISLNYGLLSLVSNILGMLIFLCLVYIIYLHAIKYEKFNSMLLLIPLLILFIFLYTSYSATDMYEAVFQGVKLLVVVCFAYYLYLVRPMSSNFMTLAVFINIVVYLSIGLCFLIYGRFSYSSFYGGAEYYGLSSNPHSLGLGLAVLAIAGLLFYMQLKKNVFILMFIADTAIILLLKVRTYQVALFMACVAIIILSRRVSAVNKVVKLALIVSLALSSQFLAVSSAASEGQRILFSSSMDSVRDMGSFSSGRIVFWSVILKYSMGRSPISLFLGDGIASTSKILNDSLSINIGAHNDFIQIIAEYGLTGFIFFLAAYAGMMRKVVKRTNYSYVLPVVCVQMVSALLNGTIYYTFSMLIFLIILYLAYGHSTADDSSCAVYSEEGLYNVQDCGSRYR